MSDLAPWAFFRAHLTAVAVLCSGMAGGNYFEVFNAGAYNATPNAKQGDLGTKVLKPRPSGTVWKRGSIQKTRWELTAAHGGGYQYLLRLIVAHMRLNDYLGSDAVIESRWIFTLLVVGAGIVSAQQMPRWMKSASRRPRSRLPGAAMEATSTWSS